MAAAGGSPFHVKQFLGSYSVNGEHCFAIGEQAQSGDPRPRVTLVRLRAETAGTTGRLRGRPEKAAFALVEGMMVARSSPPSRVTRSPEEL
jgi:hypothetical protein